VLAAWSAKATSAVASVRTALEGPRGRRGRRRRRGGGRGQGEGERAAQVAKALKKAAAPSSSLAGSAGPRARCRWRIARVGRAAEGRDLSLPAAAPGHEPVRGGQGPERASPTAIERSRPGARLALEPLTERDCARLAELSRAHRAAPSPRRSTIGGTCSASAAPPSRCGARSEPEPPLGGLSRVATQREALVRGARRRARRMASSAA
jgi:hypothetical protein